MIDLTPDELMALAVLVSMMTPEQHAVLSETQATGSLMYHPVDFEDLGRRLVVASAQGMRAEDEAKRRSGPHGTRLDILSRRRRR